MSFFKILHLICVWPSPLSLYGSYGSNVIYDRHVLKKIKIYFIVTRFYLLFYLFYFATIKRTYTFNNTMLYAVWTKKKLNSTIAHITTIHHLRLKPSSYQAIRNFVLSIYKICRMHNQRCVKVLYTKMFYILFETPMSYWIIADSLLYNIWIWI